MASGAFAVDLPRERRGKQPPAPGKSLRDWSAIVTQERGRLQPQRRISRAEVERHATRDDMWTVFKGMVYDVTRFADYHPGGPDILMQTAGRDGTIMYNKYHPWVQLESLIGHCCLGQFDAALEDSAPPAGGGGQAPRGSAKFAQAPRGHEPSGDKPPPYVPSPRGSNSSQSAGAAPPPVLVAPGISVGGADSPSSGASPKKFKKGARPGQAAAAAGAPPGAPLPWRPGDALTPAVVASSRTRERCWTVIYGKVYDVTNFLDEHPGGDEILLRHAGEDASAEFDKYHSQSAKAQLQLYYLGEVPRQAGDLLTAFSHRPAQPPRAPREDGPLTLDFRPVTLARSTELSHDTRLFVFALPQSKAPLRMMPGGHVGIRLGGVARPYTPVAVTGGEVHVAVKRYPEGALTPQLHELQSGGTAEMRGPLPCEYDIAARPAADLVLAAGGTGAAPILSLARAQCEAGRRAWVVVSDKTRQDVLFAPEFAALAAASDGRLRLRRVFTRAESSGEDVPRLDGDTADPVLGCRLDPASAADMVGLAPEERAAAEAVVCGPKQFNAAVAAALRSIGFSRVTTLGD
eukprot:TRINITY_DN65657_c0_g1_i1.p1 TRINITY_DN65657_c0_g1~~TRINITY_DN65657_c0_g1_i1.p1  ORF type:complete len:575 (+),score=105.53 TRINITY_DN65657_c0_g1_i1:75-1799(+)